MMPAQEIDAAALSTREINRQIKAAMATGQREIQVQNPGARHNLAVGLVEPVQITFAGSVGYFLGGMMDGPHLQVTGNCGWSAGECMLQGEIVVDGYAGNSVAASMRGGTVVVRGDAGARAGIALKGGVLLIGGSAGYMSGFMMQKGMIIICGDAGPAIGDSMYDGAVFVGGSVLQLGSDTVVGEPSGEDETLLAGILARYGVPHPGSFKKITSGHRLWNFSRKEMGLWIEAL